MSTAVKRRALKSNPLMSVANSYLLDSPQPSNLSYMWNFGSLLGTVLVGQIVTGVLLAMHYSPDAANAFISVEHIMRDVEGGWLIRYFHANGASLFFAFVYMHIARGIYYGSYKSPRTLAWTIGVIILVLMIITAFLGYCLVYGQMSLWGATVISSMLTAVPWLGHDIAELIWGGFSVNAATLNRFYSLHFLLPFLLAGVAVTHLMAVHEHGSSNPLGVDANVDRLPMGPHFLFKDLVTIFAYGALIMGLLSYTPNWLGHGDNYIPANPMVTPASIVPEWYLLPYYAVLRSVPNKLAGVFLMLASLLILLILPIVDTHALRGSMLRPAYRVCFWSLAAVFYLLFLLGAMHAEAPWTTAGQVLTSLYFLAFTAGFPLAKLLSR